jgi:hypothetical protein
MLSLCIPLVLMASIGAGKTPADSLSIEVSSGGVSLGSYQGGYLLAKTLCDRDSAAYRILTGASAGAINMLGGLYYCYHAPRPGWSPYATWLNVDWKDLMPQRPRSGHLFRTDSIESILAPIVAGILTPPTRVAGAPKVVWLGFAITRFQSRFLHIGGLTSPKMDEKIVIGMQWLPMGSAMCPDSLKANGCWRAWTEVDKGWGLLSPQPFIDFGRNGTDPAEIARNLRDLALASSAFPVAFPRHGLHLALLDSGVNIRRYAHCGTAFPDPDSCPGYGTTFEPREAAGTVFLELRTGDPAYGKWLCSRFPSFSDGGIFENEPLHLAQRVRVLLQGAYPGLTGLKNVSSVGFVLPSHYDSLFSQPPDIHIRRSEIAEWTVFWLNRRSEAEGEMEVSRFLEERDFPEDKFHLSSTSVPLAGEHFQHFSAFFRREFRDFDFAVGLRDGFRQTLDGSLDDRAKFDSAQALLGPIDSGRAADLRYVWGELDPVDSLMKHPQDPPRENWVARRIKSVFVEDTGAGLLEKRYRALDPVLQRLRDGEPVRTGPERLKSVLRGSLSRMRGTLKNLAEAKEEKDGDRLESFADGYKTPIRRTAPAIGRGAEDTRLYAADSTYFLGRTIADSVYQGIIDLVASDDLGLGNSVIYPFVLYHARLGMGAATGAIPSFHTPYLHIDGAKNGFRLMQGLPLLSSRVGTEFGLHFLDCCTTGRFEAHAYAEFSWSWWAVANIGIGLEAPADYRNCWVWPRSELVVGDILTLGFDFRDGSNPFHRGTHLSSFPVVSVGSRVGFDFWQVSKGSLRGTNDERRIRNHERRRP